MRLRPFDEVGDDEEVAGELHVHDDVELEGEPLVVIVSAVPRREAVMGEPGGQALARLPAQLLDLVHCIPAGNGEARQDGLSRQRPVGAADGDLDAGLGRLGQVGEQSRHLGAGLEPVLGREAAPLGGREKRALGDAEQGVMRLVVGGGGEIGLVGRDQRQAAAVGELDQRRLGHFLGFEPVALELHVEAVAENLGEALEATFGEVGHVMAERAVDRAGRPAGQRDEAVAAHQRVEGDVRLVAVLRIEPQARHEPHEMAVAGLGLGQQHDRRAGNAQLCEARGGGRRVAEIDRRLRPDDRLHAGLGELLREFERAEQVVGVGDGERRHLVGLGELGERLDGQRALAQREGAVHVQMHEADGFEDG